MNILIALSAIVFLAITVESAQPMRREDKNSNLAVMLAYRPNSEIRSRDLKNNKSWTFKVAESEEENEESDGNVNNELLEALIKDKLAKRFNPSEVDDRRTVKRENKNRDGSESLENASNEAKVVELEKKVCYKNTYKNVLNAFEEALKSQIENYKKCVCQKKKDSTTTTTTEVTIKDSVLENAHQRNFSDEDEGNDENNSKVSINNDQAIETALDHQDDIICFHRQYAFMLNKLLDHIPCKKNKRAENPPNPVEKFQGASVKREERNNNFIEDFDEESDSVEIDVSEITSPKPKAITTVKPTKKVLKTKSEKFNQEKINEQVMAILKEHLGSSTTEKPAVKRSQKKHETTTKQQLSPKKITIKAKQVEDEEESKEESKEFAQQEFVAQLQELFQKYQVTPEETFPLQSEEHHAERTSSLPLRKPAKKSPIRNTVNESSDESTEASVKLKNRKLEKERVQLRENSRKAPTSRSSAINHNTIADDRATRNDNNITKKSYRTSPRTNDTRNNSAEDENVRRSSNNAKKSGKSSRPSNDSRLASDLAKKVSDFARGKSSKKQE
jgi:hypothetical protein